MESEESGTRRRKTNLDSVEGDSSRSSRVERVGEGELFAENVVSSVTEERPGLRNSV